MWSTGLFKSGPSVDLPLPIEVRRIAAARRMRLRFDEARGILKLTCPTRISAAKALRWAGEQRAWIEAQIAASAPGEPFDPGATIPIDGNPIQLVWDPAAPRAPSLVGSTLRIGGAPDGFGRRVESFLKRHALERMSAEVAEFAEVANVSAASVSVGDAATRWGSCSSQGRIRLSWRLILASPDVRRFVVAHEVAHLAHLHHGPEFRALEKRLVGPRIAEVKAKLRSEGPFLRRLGRRR